MASDGVTNWKAVSPEHRKKIAPIVKHYMNDPHPFTACVRDNTKRFGEERAKRICAVVKDMGKRTTKWRKGKTIREAVDEAAKNPALAAGPLLESIVDEVWDDVWAPVLDAEKVTVDELADWSQMAADAGLVETAPLEVRVDVGDLALLEATAPTAGQRLAKRGKTRSGATTVNGQAYTEGKHPRGRGGQWTIKSGASGEDVRTVQRHVGAKADGKFGAMTKSAVMEFQRKHGLQVDGEVGHQTATALAGHFEAARSAKVGGLKDSDRQKLKALRRTVKPKSGQVKTKRLRESALTMAVEIGDLAVRETAATGALALRVGDDMRLVESFDWLTIREEFDLVIVESLVSGEHVAFDLALMEAELPGDRLFNSDGTIDFVIARPCNGKGIGNRIYEADMLARDAHVFAGWPVYDNHEHPDAARARRGIPRPPSDLAGEIRESWWDGAFTTPRDEEAGFGVGAVIGRFMLTEDMERLVRRLPHRVKTSMNATATGMHAGRSRGRRGMIVEGILNDPAKSSVDLVTKAGAGGEVAALYRDMAAV